jgi:L-asparaginase
MFETGNAVHLVSTGGTIDKFYEPVSGNLLVGPPVLAGILALAGISGLPLMEVLRKDSLEITDAERAQLAASIAESPASRLLITHGTDTMGASAAAIAEAAPGKTVVLTGAMVPYAIDGSDAAVNVAFAYAAAQLLPPGVYIAMHGRALPHVEYVKDRAAGRFVAETR